MDAETFGDAEEYWPAFDERAVVSPCEACGTPADERQGVDFLKAEPWLSRRGFIGQWDICGDRDLRTRREPSKQVR